MRTKKYVYNYIHKDGEIVGMKCEPKSKIIRLINKIKRRECKKDEK